MKTKALLMTALLALLVPAPAPAADLLVAPPALSMNIATGESASTTILGSVSTVPPPPAPFIMTLHLRPVSGTMPPPWLIAQPTTFMNRTTSLLLPFTVRVPATAAPGTYTAFVQPVVMSSSVPIVPPSRPVQLSLTVTSKCPASPAVAIASTQPVEFKAPNGRLADVCVAGSIVVPPGCTLAHAWYALVDEYGIFGETGDIAAASDGSFEFTTPVQVSRRGDDGDGRAYQFTVFAEDEAGTGSSPPAAVVVRHDQRKGE